MSLPKTPDPRDFDLASFGEMLWRRIALPSEEPGSFEIFREEMTRDLLPMTPYEAVIVESLIRTEWTIREHGHMRDTALRAGILDAARNLLVSARKKEHDAAAKEAFDSQYDGLDEHGKAWEEPELFDAGAAQSEGEALARRLGSADPARLDEADRVLAGLGTSRMELLVAVWNRLAATLARHDEAIRDNERRRRELLKDLEQLQRRRPIEGSLES
ncbi:hypothetical protein HKCCSP123_02125 [Rhodobacterales bacterium HKCCSP123]|nr:hypothetical protein [Rhodobacterales bacterium HKCCSP123]